MSKGGSYFPRSGSLTATHLLLNTPRLNPANTPPASPLWDGNSLLPPPELPRRPPAPRSLPLSTLKSLLKESTYYLIAFYRFTSHDTLPTSPLSDIPLPLSKTPPLPLSLPLNIVHSLLQESSNCHIVLVPLFMKVCGACIPFRGFPFPLRYSLKVSLIKKEKKIKGKYSSSLLTVKQINHKGKILEQSAE